MIGLQTRIRAAEIQPQFYSDSSIVAMYKTITMRFTFQAFSEFL
jgi:hypothetical protein